MSLGLRAVAAAICVAAAAVSVSAAPADKPMPPEARAEYLYGMPDGLDLERLVDKPTLVGTHNYVFTDAASGQRRLGGYAEILAVYDIPLEDLVAVGMDVDSYPSWVPRIFSARLLSQDGSTYVIQYHTGIKFLGIEVAYDTVMETILERLPGGVVGTRARLLESLDGAAYEGYNSFYFRPVTVRGKAMTFIRYFNRPGIVNPSAAMLPILNLFAGPEAKAQVAAVAKEALKRAKRR